MLLILASQSPQRKIILTQLGIPFEIIPAEINEKKIRFDDLSLQAREVAKAKAEKIASMYPQAVIVAADTFVGMKGKVFEKPSSIAEARNMLRSQSGQTINAYTGYCFIDGRQQLQVCNTTTTKATFRQLSETEIENYIAHNPVMTWSAAFSPAYPAGMALISSISGSLTGFSHGLPLDQIAPLIEQSRAFDTKFDIKKVSLELS